MDIQPMRVTYQNTLILLLFLAFLSSCSEYQKVMKGTDYDKKYEMVLKYYDKKDYYKTTLIIDQIKNYYKGTDKDMLLGYYYAYSQYGLKDYYGASYFFKALESTYPLGEKAEECAYMSAYCKYLDSPVSSLDQTNTYDAISELQHFERKYPTSKRIEEGQQLVVNLKKKLEDKAFDIAMQYYKTEQYQAAIKALKNVLKDYPETLYKEDIYFYSLKSSYKYAANSVLQKQEERYQFTLDAYKEFFEYFPSGAYQKEAKGLYESAQKSLEQLHSINN